MPEYVNAIHVRCGGVVRLLVGDAELLIRCDAADEQPPTDEPTWTWVPSNPGVQMQITAPEAVITSLYNEGARNVHWIELESPGAVVLIDGDRLSLSDETVTRLIHTECDVDFRFTSGG